MGVAWEEQGQSGLCPCLLQVGMDFIPFLLHLVLCVVVSLLLFGEGSLLESQLLFPTPEGSFFSFQLDEVEVLHSNPSVRQGSQGSEKRTVQHRVLTVYIFLTLVVEGVVFFFLFCQLHWLGVEGSLVVGRRIAVFLGGNAGLP